MNNMQIVVIGGGAAGTTAALEIRKKMRDASITIIESQKYSEYSPCALPFVVGGHIAQFKDILIHSDSFYSTFAKIDLRLETTASSIDRESKEIICGKKRVAYDKLVLATGSYPFRPPIKGIDAIDTSERIFLLKSIDDAKRVDACANTAKRALIIGAGLVGMEMAVALWERGISVTILEALPTAMPQMLDPDMGKIVIDHLHNLGIDIQLEIPVEEIADNGKEVKVTTAEGIFTYDMCVIACGVRANMRLAGSAGLSVGNGILVSDTMVTSDPDIYACGDCCESVCAVTGKSILSQLGSTAVRQAKVVASQMAGGIKRFRPTFNTSITQLYNLHIASVGATLTQANINNIGALSSRFKGSTLPDYYPGGNDIFIKLIFTVDKKIIGGQIIGEQGVLDRINVLSTVMQLDGDLDFIYNMETAYTPPLSPTIDPLSWAAEMAIKKCEKHYKKDEI